MEDLLALSTDEINARMREIDNKVAARGYFTSVQEVKESMFSDEYFDDEEYEDYLLTESYEELENALHKKEAYKMSSFPGELPLDNYELYNGYCAATLSVSEVIALKEDGKKIFASGPESITPGILRPKSVYYELLHIIPDMLNSTTIITKWRKTNTEGVLDIENFHVLIKDSDKISIYYGIENKK